MSWLTLTESDAMTLVRVFCLMPYCPLARPTHRPRHPGILRHTAHARKIRRHLHQGPSVPCGIFSRSRPTAPPRELITLVKWWMSNPPPGLAKDIGMNPP